MTLGRKNLPTHAIAGDGRIAGSRCRECPPSEIIAGDRRLRLHRGHPCERESRCVRIVFIGNSPCSIGRCLLLRLFRLAASEDGARQAFGTAERDRANNHVSDVVQRGRLEIEQRAVIVALIQPFDFLKGGGQCFAILLRLARRLKSDSVIVDFALERHPMRGLPTVEDGIGMIEPPTVRPRQCIAPRTDFRVRHEPDGLKPSRSRA